MIVGPHQEGANFRCGADTFKAIRKIGIQTLP
jgi:hypothetical protein